MKLHLCLFVASFFCAALRNEPVHGFSFVTRTTSVSVTSSVSPWVRKQSRFPSMLGVSRSTDRPTTTGSIRIENLALVSKDDVQEDTSLPIELVGLGVMLTLLTGFILVNQFVGPWPMNIFTAMPPPSWLLLHYLGGVLFAGGIIVSTALEWLVVETTAAAAPFANDKNNNSRQQIDQMAPVLDFLFDRVPIMDAALVVPGLVLALVSGVAVATAYYEGLATSPPHIVWAFRTLVAFAIWWAVTDVATQGPAAKAVQEWKESGTEDTPLPSILYQRRLSNIGSCLFVVGLYAIMALKPGL
uniref:Uncharacterized protein n=1 Tax=Amphora coffeiformis TaxID=265554 RepID=A0A7S3KVQ3_9STRA